MRRLLALLIPLFLSLAHARAAASPTSSPRTVQALGQNYLSLRDWAERSKLELLWNPKDEELRLTNSLVFLDLKINSQRTTINGITVFLAFPVIAHNGEPFLASRDANRVLAPILQPSKNRPGERVRTIALCPGHGGQDAGYQIGAEQEKGYTLLLAREVRRQLQRAGFKVVMLRDSDTYVAREERPALARRKKADLYVSLHYNSAGEPTRDVQGCEVYCLALPGTQSTNGGHPHPGAEPGNRHDDKNLLLAFQMQRSLVRNLGLNDRGVRRARFVMLRLAEMPAILIETAFMSNPDEMRRIRDPAFRQRTAQAIVTGIQNYKRIVEP